MLRGFILKSATETIADSTIDFDKKVRVIEAAFRCIQVLAERDGVELVRSYYDDVSQAFFGLLFSKNEDVDLSDCVYSVFKKYQSEASLSFIE